MFSALFVDYAVGDWSLLKKTTESSGFALFEAEYEMALAVFLGAILDGNNSAKEQMMSALGSKLQWTDWRKQIFRERIDSLPSYSVDRFETAPKVPELAHAVTKLALAASRLDGSWSANEMAFARNLANRCSVPGESFIQWQNEIEGIASDGVSAHDDADLESELQSLMSSTRRGDRQPDQPTSSGKNASPGVAHATQSASPERDEDTLQCCLEELNKLVGLEAVKEEISKLSDFLKVQKMRKDAGLATALVSNHMVFTGNPGTGKTTVARLVARIFKALGFLKKGHLVEVDRGDLVGQYVGHTETKTRDVINSALNGILFIDEAYSLVSEGKEDFGKQAIDTLVKMMEDHRKRLVVIVAGYSEQMKGFIDANPGLESRFSTYIGFPNYDVDALIAIFRRICEHNEYTLAEDALPKVRQVMEHGLTQEPESFGNGRYCRNLFEQSLRIHAMRLARASEPPTKEALSLLTAADFVAP